MTARAFTGLRVVLVAAFNRRYHRSGLALAAALEGLGCEVRRCEERRRGWNALLGRSLATRLAACLRAGPVDVVLVFKGASLAPADVAELRRRCGGHWVNWFPDDPHQLELSTRLAPAYDRFFTHDSSSLARHRAAGARAHYLAFGCDPEFLRPPPPSRPSDARWATPRATEPARTCGYSSSRPWARRNCRMRKWTSRATSRRIARSCCIGAWPSSWIALASCSPTTRCGASSPSPRESGRCGSTRGVTVWRSC